MNLPETLHARMYLLAYDTEKNRLTSRSHLGLVLRAAALTELYLADRVADDGGKARVTDTKPTGDPLMDDLLQQIADHRPRSWYRWISRQERAAVRTVRDQLEAAHCLKVERRSIMPDRIELRDRRAVKQYADEVRAALGKPAARTEPRVAAVLALAARGEVKTVVSRRERREHKQRLNELAVHTGPVADALRKALQAAVAATAAAS